VHTCQAMSRQSVIVTGGRIASACARAPPPVGIDLEQTVENDEFARVLLQHLVSLASCPPVPGWVDVGSRSLGICPDLDWGLCGYRPSTGAITIPVLRPGVRAVHKRITVETARGDPRPPARCRSAGSLDTATGCSVTSLAPIVVRAFSVTKLEAAYERTNRACRKSQTC
jgi:hypothetical protein